MVANCWIALFSLTGSLLLGKMGYYQVYLLAGGVFSTVGAGLIYILQPNSKASAYIGYQVLVSIGSGLVVQLPVIVAQAISPRVDVAITVAITLCKSFITLPPPFGRLLTIFFTFQSFNFLVVPLVCRVLRT